FFFQVEDGIRDFHVTGVQTCALPISFIDGRSDFYAPEIRDDYMSILGSDWKADDVLKKYDFQAALLPLEWAITSALKQSPEWQEIGRASCREIIVLSWCYV